MLHTKFRENRPAGSGVEDCLVVVFFTIYGRGGLLGHVTWISQSFVTPIHGCST